MARKPVRNWLVTKEVLQLLNISDSALRYAIRTGQLPFTEKVENVYLFWRNDVERLKGKLKSKTRIEKE